MTDTAQLLKNFVNQKDEQAFRQLVERHVNLVYSTALRRVNGNGALAEDIAQTVFTDLAGKAKRLDKAVILSGWLYQHTCFTASNTLRKERRRLAREQQALEMNTLHQDEEAGWKQLAPMLEDSMSQLPAPDRDAIVLRWFENHSWREVGMELGVSEDAARMRVERATEKLRTILSKRGLKVSATVLTTVVAAQAVTAAPVGLAAGISGTALAGSSTLLVSIFKLALAGGSLLVLVGFIYFASDATKSGQVATEKKAGTNRISFTTDEKKLLLRKPAVGQNYQISLNRRARGSQPPPSNHKDWDRKYAAFTTPPDEAGVQNYGAKAQTTLLPDELWAIGGWETHAGKRLFIFMSAQTRPDKSSGEDMLVIPRMAEVPDTQLEQYGLQSFRGAPRESLVTEKISEETYKQLIDALNKDWQKEKPVMVTMGGTTMTKNIRSQLSMEFPVFGTDQKMKFVLSLMSENATSGVGIDVETIAQIALSPTNSPGVKSKYTMETMPGGK